MFRCSEGLYTPPSQKLISFDPLCFDMASFSFLFVCFPVFFKIKIQGKKVLTFDFWIIKCTQPTKQMYTVDFIYLFIYFYF